LSACPEQASAVAASFFKHWRDLCDPNELAPDLTKFLDRYNPATAPFTHIVDFDDGRLSVRLYGTGLTAARGADLTGASLKEFMPGPVYESVKFNYACILGRPCGLHARDLYTLANGLTYEAAVLSLPLAVKGRRSSVVGIIDVLGLDKAFFGNQGFGGVTDIGWIDIGFGVPEQPPQALAAPSPQKRSYR